MCTILKHTLPAGSYFKKVNGFKCFFLTVNSQLAPFLNHPTLLFCQKIFQERLLTSVKCTTLSNDLRSISYLLEEWNKCERITSEWHAMSLQDVNFHDFHETSWENQNTYLTILTRLHVKFSPNGAFKVSHEPAYYLFPSLNDAIKS